MWNNTINDTSRLDGARDAYFASADLAMDRLQSILDNPASTPSEIAEARNAIEQLRADSGRVANMTSDLSVQYETSQLNDRVDALMDGAVDAGAEQASGWVGRAFSESFSRGGIGGGVNVSDGASLYAKMSSDPQGFASYWKDLSPEDRQLAMFTLQTYVQDQNQLTTMMTNMLSASHQTSSAIARNLSV
jgi:hypothetical protein